MYQRLNIAGISFTSTLVKGFGVFWLLLLLFTCQRFEPEQLILLETGSVADITYKGCRIDGDILDVGKDGIGEHGFCWSQSRDPNLENGEFNKLGSRSTTGTYSSILDSLSQNTTYYIKAYATGASGTSYGEEEIFTTSAQTAPLVHTLAVTNITLESARSGGEISSDGGAAITVKGVCWSTKEQPTLEDQYTEDGDGSGSFSSSLIRLSCGTTYFVRAYAINSQGTSYGDQLEFSTSACPEGLPAVTTAAITGITEANAVGGGTVSDEGTSPVTSRGVCWSTLENPLISDNHTTNGGGSGSFVSSLSGLSCGTIYYVRAYATNSTGTAYGDQEEFTTSGCPVGLPTVGTLPVTNITETSAQGGGNVTDDGGASVTMKGICWSTSEEPDLGDNYSEEGIGTGSFFSSMTGLNCGTTYYVRAYATNGEGTSFGEQLEFRTSNCPLDPPTVTTTEVTDITQTTAQGGGDVTDNGGASVTAKGICYGTAQNPSLEDTHTVDGTGTGTYSSILTGLECGTVYYVRAYATNAGGTSYGNQVEFSSGVCLSLPSVVTSEVINVMEFTAECGGEVTNDGNTEITARGVCWSTSSGPEITDYKTEDGTGIGIFSSSLTGLSEGTAYYVRAYAINSEGTAYGEERMFETWEGSVTDYDGNVYPIVTIGEQVWMQRNLRVTHYEDGTPITLVEGNAEWADLISEKAYCWYDNNPEHRELYGAIYTWPATVNNIYGSETNPSGIQGVCPSGWHMPSDSEWKEMEMFLGMSSSEADSTDFRGNDEGGKLKEEGIEHWSWPNLGATNESGFSALPGGIRGPDGEIYGMKDFTYFWTASGSGGYAYGRGLDAGSQQINRFPHQWNNGYYVRCVQDQ